MNTAPGIVRRIQKAEKDYADGDYENALIQALIAVAATSAARYPNLGDRVRFEKVLAEDFGPNLGANFAIKGGFIKVSYKGSRRRLNISFMNSLGANFYMKPIYHLILSSLIPRQAFFSHHGMVSS